MKCCLCHEEIKDEFLVRNVYVRIHLPYPKRVSRMKKIGKICAVCLNDLIREENNQ